MHTRFLVDTGSEVSVADRHCQLDKVTLTAVNNTPICTYGKQFLNLNLGLRCPLLWIFVIAEVQKPIIGADFLQHSKLLVNMKKQQLTDSHTHIRVHGILSMDSSPSSSLFPKNHDNPSLTLLSEFSTLMQISLLDIPIRHDVAHHIQTVGPPVSARPRRRAPDRLMMQSRSLSTCLTWVSTDHHQANGHHPYTWCPRRLVVIGVLVEITTP